MAKKDNKTTGTTMSPMDMAQNPNFNSLMKNQNYFNMISQLLAERQARGPEYGLMPIPSPDESRRMEAAMAERNAALTGGTAQPINDPEFIDLREPGKNYTMNMVNYVDPTTGQMVARTSGIVPRPGSRFVPENTIGGAQIPNLPTTATSQIPPVPPVELQPALPIQQPQARRVQPTFRGAMAMQTYNNLMQQQLNALATNRINESMQMPAQQIPTSNKAAENYASLIPGQMSQQTNTTAPRIPTIPGMQQPSGFGSSQTENMPRQRQPRVGFGYLPKNEIAPVGY